MNVSGMFRSMLGEVKAGEAKPLELRTGQVVRGVVQQLVSEQEAVLSINGVQVRARLETPLATGQATMLQVQPMSEDGQIVLKPLDASSVPIADASLKEVLKSLDLPDTPDTRQLVQLLHRSGIALTKDNVQAFAAVRSMVPAHISPEQWLGAAVIAFHKGLPLNSETVASIQRAVQGQPLHAMLGELGEAAARALERQPQLSAQSRGWLEQLRVIIQQIKQASAELTRADGETAARVPAGGPAGSPAALPLAQAPGQFAAGAPIAPPPGGTPGGAMAAGAAAVPGGSAAAVPQAVPPGSAPPAGAPAAPASSASASPAVASNAIASPAPADGHWIGQIFKALGLDHESGLLKHWGRSDVGSPPHLSAVHSEGAEQARLADSLKSVLLQLAAAEDVPESFKEAAKQAVQHITGQQLLLSSDRSAPFSHITLFVPLQGPDGGQTASIHIQSRKSGNGALDPDNCRLVFDLRMKSLGNTMVDVQVVDRIVSLHVRNDLPFLQELLDSHRDEIAAGMASIGYQFISMKYSAYPVPTSEASPGSDVLQTPRTEAAAGTGYIPKRYKGVDYRI